MIFSDWRICYLYHRHQQLLLLYSYSCCLVWIIWIIIELWIIFQFKFEWTSAWNNFAVYIIISVIFSLLFFWLTNFSLTLSFIPYTCVYIILYTFRLTFLKNKIKASYLKYLNTETTKQYTVTGPRQGK